MASSTSAVLDVISENKYLTTLLKDVEKLNISNQSLENSIIQSSSCESFSTIQDIEIDENSDLCVKIDNPQKHLETLETFVTFRILTKVARIEFSENEYVVRRRYNDFVWLRQKLIEKHPFCIIPPLPGKHSLIGQLDRYSKEFIFTRMKSLNTFMSRIVHHPILSCNEHLKIFLTAKQPDFNLFRRQRTNTDVKIKSLSHINSNHSALKSRHMEFDKTKTYLNILSEKLSSIDKISSRINRARIELVNELVNFHPIFTNWADCEPELAPLIRGIGRAIEQSATSENSLIRNYNNTINNPLKDFLSYIDVVQDVLKKREYYQSAYENSLDELNKRYNEKDRLMLVASKPSNTPNSGFFSWKQPNCDEKLEKLGFYIPQLLKKVESHQDNLECANESLRSDLERWQFEKKENLENIFMDFVRKQIEYYQKSLDAWENIAEQFHLHNNINSAK